MLILMNGTNKNLPELLIDSENCKYLKKSLEKAEASVTHKSGVKFVGKVKKNEKSKNREILLSSTNFSDAFKYMECTESNLNISKNKSTVSFSSFVKI